MKRGKMSLFHTSLIPQSFFSRSVILPVQTITFLDVASSSPSSRTILDNNDFISLLTYIIHSGFISGYQNRYGDNLKPPTNVYHRMTA